MFKSIAVYRSLKCLKPFKSQFLCPLTTRTLSSDNKSSDGSADDKNLSQLNDKQTDESSADNKTLTFAKAFEKFEKMVEESKDTKKSPENVDNEMFPTLLRYSTYIQMGDPEAKIVVGRIEDIVNDDLYIDFGCKFNAVCKLPKVNQSDYVRGAKVRLRINDLELSDRFLGSSKDMTLLEAEATLLGIIWSPTRSGDRSVEEGAQEVDNI